MASTECKLLSGICPDDHCQTKLFFPPYDRSIECPNCGQRHERSMIKSIVSIVDEETIMKSMLRNVLLSNVVPKRGADMVLVNGLSNYHCKLLSAILTEYGMDRNGIAKPLRELDRGDMFDCSVLHDRSFMIDVEHLNVVGYGRDVSGSSNYLADTLEHVRLFNEGEQRLIPIHADGDGHCLVHAISRALVGRELFWHPLRCNLKRHLEDNLHKYKLLFKEFVDDRDWQAIVDECDPLFIPPDGELLGLRNIHIFGLANVLKRPIVLLDSMAGMQSLGDYSALFLPILVNPSECKGKDSTLNKPLCLAWSSSGRNHYIPLVGLKSSPLPKLHKTIVPKAWGTEQTQVEKYIEFDDEGFCYIGGDRVLGDSYVIKLAAAMDKVYLDKNGVHPKLVADVHHYVYRRIGVVGAQPQQVLRATQKAVEENRLYRCLVCEAVCEQNLCPIWFKKDGILYKLAKQNHGRLVPNNKYKFPLHSVICVYDAERDELVPESGRYKLERCTWCTGSKLRLLNGDNNIQYENGDQTKTTSIGSKCTCGFKHFWNGKEYDNNPQEFPVILEWNKRRIVEKVSWFQEESEPSLNSNAYHLASCLVQKYFPGEFGSEILLKNVVDQILDKTKSPELFTPQPPPMEPPTEQEARPTKIIIAGPKLIHKEELGVSQFEKQLKNKVHLNATQQQHKRQTVEATLEKSKAKKSNSPPKKEAKSRFIRIVTSDGRQSCYHLEENPPTYETLQDWITLEFNIPPNEQHLKCGVPPKDLRRPSLADMSRPLTLRHGDRVLVEITKEESSTTESLAASILSSLSDPSMVPEESALLITAMLSGKSVWEYAQTLPDMFKKNGFFYRQVENSTGLVGGKHYQLNHIPDKIFRFNVQQECLEICLEPYGHFPIGPNVIEDAIKNHHSNVISETIIPANPVATAPEKLIRKGPGFSVLAPPPPLTPPTQTTNEKPSTTEQLRDIFASISQFADNLEDMDSNDENESGLDENKENHMDLL